MKYTERLAKPSPKVVLTKPATGMHATPATMEAIANGMLFFLLMKIPLVELIAINQVESNPEPTRLGGYGRRKYPASP